MAVTIRDVAKEAGVSVATVSRVINDNGYVHEDTRKAVLEAVNKLNYKPNEVARSLFKKKSKLIGLILPDITNPFFPALARGIEDYVHKEGYRLIFGNSDGELDKEIDYLETFKQNNVVGIIASINHVDRKVLDTISIPLVFLDRTVGDFPSVYADQEQGGRLAATQILKRGSKEVTIVRGPVNLRNVYQRYEASILELKGTSVKVNVLDSDLTFDSAKEQAKVLFAKYPQTDSVFACNDIVAVAILNEALRIGKSIPEDVQIIGFDNISISELVYPGLSTIHQPAYEMGTKAAEILINQINKEKLPNIHYKIPVSFVERKTTRKVGE